jgi:carboxypeptidase PM20D1
MAVANIWLFRPLILRALSAMRGTNAMIRTTFAATMAKASNAANVLPQKAQALINVRLLPGDSVAGVEAHFKRLADRLKLPLTIRTFAAAEPSQVSPAEGTVYRHLTALIGEIYPGTNESITIANYGRMIHFFARFIEEFDAEQAADSK